MQVQALRPSGHPSASMPPRCRSALHAMCVWTATKARALGEPLGTHQGTPGGQRGRMSSPPPQLLRW
eukprot:10010804-Lingulodinium_polyedra.AAC.1